MSDLHDTELKERVSSAFIAVIDSIGNESDFSETSQRLDALLWPNGSKTLDPRFSRACAQLGLTTQMVAFMFKKHRGQPCDDQQFDLSALRSQLEIHRN